MRKMILPMIAFIVALMLVAPASAQTTPTISASDIPLDILTKLKLLTPDGVQAAYDDAMLNGDPYSPDCWTVLKPLVSAAATTNPVGKVVKPAPKVDLAVAYQKLRDARRKVQAVASAVTGGATSAQDVAIVKGCAPMFMDSRQAILQLIAVLTTGKIAGAGLLP